MVKIEENTDIDVSSFNSTSVRLNALCEIHLSAEDARFNSTSVRLNGGGLKTLAQLNTNELTRAKIRIIS